MKNGQTLSDEVSKITDRFAELTGHQPDGVWEAPGRVNLIGEHTDYNGGLALPFAIERHTTIALRSLEQAELRCFSTDYPGWSLNPVSAIRPGAIDGWPAYVAGVFWALVDKGWEPHGLELLISSSVPSGSGLSSSAALTVSTAMSINDRFELGLGQDELVDIAHRAESEFVGAPVGRLDQTAIVGARASNALLIDFESHSISHVPLKIGPLVVVDTKVKHANVEGDYAQRRLECEQASNALGYASLRSATLEEVETRLSGTLQRRARHVVTENARVMSTVDALRSGTSVGDAIFASHRSLRDDFEVSCFELDAVVSVAERCGAIGARMVGGGFGGSAVVVGVEVELLQREIDSAFSKVAGVIPEAFEVKPSAGARRIG
ncbi:MAG: galactokinase [Acidimicrobiaceae bacterium]|nr:galactokinase [Acidimicrobiaceae bacterium]